MGNLWIAHFDSSSSSPSSTRPSSPGLTKSTSNEGTHSGAGSAFSSSLDEVSPNGQILPITPTLKIFSFAELKKATRNFRPDAVVGEGCFGTVFKGWIDEKTFAPTKAWSGMAIAVKKLNSDGLQGRKEWQSEVNILGSLSHPNIVRLLGLCEEDKELLVYEFIPSGSLANHLFSRGSAFQTLSWSIRLKIAIGVARGLAFLHCSERKIIHRNLTPSNVLIDSNYNAKISDFRLARDGPPLGGNSHVTMRVMGTYGYLAPEYVATGRLYVKSDVYSFGVVLLELLSGRRALDPKRPSGQHILAEWARPYLSDPRNVLLLVMDQRLEGQYPSEGAVQAAQLILMCLGYEPRRRPPMSEVVETLEEIQAIKHKPQEPKNNPRRPTDHNHAHHHAHLFYLENA